MYRATVIVSKTIEIREQNQKVITDVRAIEGLTINDLKNNIQTLKDSLKSKHRDPNPSLLEIIDVYTVAKTDLNLKDLL